MEEAPQEIARAVCPKAYQCCTPMQMENNDLAGTDEPSCEAKTTQGFKNNLDAVRGSIAKDRARYHGDKLATCLAHIRAATCEDLNRTNHFSGIGCDPWIEPLVSPGGACGLDVECIEGSCDKGGGMSGDGVCRPLPVAGEPCAGVRCARGNECDGTTKTCVATVPERGVTKPGQCFYASACSYGGRGGFPAGLLLVVAALLFRLRLLPRSAGEAGRGTPRWSDGSVDNSADPHAPT
jgi:hypothetical protein